MEKCKGPKIRSTAWGWMVGYDSQSICSYIVDFVARVEPGGDNDQTLRKGGIQKPLMEIMNLIES